jgi:hypothetical protein
MIEALSGDRGEVYRRVVMRRSSKLLKTKGQRLHFIGSFLGRVFLSFVPFICLIAGRSDIQHPVLPLQEALFPVLLRR